MFSALDELHASLKDIIEIDNETLTVKDSSLLKQKLIDQLIYTAIFSENIETQQEAKNLIKKIAQSLTITSSSIRDFYMAIGANNIIQTFTIPAMNIRTLTYDTACMVFRLAKEKAVGPFVFEISRGEMDYTHQRPEAFTVAVFAAAIKEGYQGPIFLQGDHFQFNEKNYHEDPEKERASLKALIDETIAGQFYNIDIDASTLVDLSKENLDDQQKENYENTALLTTYIREHQPKDVTISIGGEIGHIGDRNSTVGDFGAFMQGYLPLIKDYQGLSKISVQTGTSHGGIPMPDGKIQEVTLDFSVLETIGQKARETYHIGGAVQHGASTLPNGMFHIFPEKKTLEIHLATGFQNIIYDHLPNQLKNTIYAWLNENMQKEKDPTWTEEQFIYKTRKKALGVFEKELWTLAGEAKQPILDALQRELLFLFEKLGVFNTKDILAQYILSSSNKKLSDSVILKSMAEESQQEHQPSSSALPYRTIADEKIENKKIFLRVDFDVSLNPNHTIANDTRITQTLPTIHKLLATSNKLIIASHLGRPEGRDEKLSLKPVVADLQKYVPDHTIILIDDFLSEEGKKQLANQQPNEIMMLENLRFYLGEKKNNKEFAKQLASLADIYVNDAFAVCHRNDASIVSLPTLLPHYAGLLLQKEITAISHVLTEAKKPVVAIIGGAKTSDKLPLLYKLTEIADYLLLGGGVANTFLKVDGFTIGNSIVEENQDEEVKKILAHAKDKNTTIVLPRDVICASGPQATSGIECAVNHIAEDQHIVDMGSESEALFGNIIAKANTIVWNGPVGYIENPAFARGTEFLYYAITQNDHAYSIVGGGDTLNAISKKEYLDKITHVSTGGGAMLEFIEKGILPGIEALK